MGRLGVIGRRHTRSPQAYQDIRRALCPYGFGFAVALAAVESWANQVGAAYMAHGHLRFTRSAGPGANFCPGLLR